MVHLVRQLLLQLPFHALHAVFDPSQDAVLRMLAQMPKPAPKKDPIRDLLMSAY